MNGLEALGEEFDLRYRPETGDRTYYHLKIIYRPLDQLGAPLHREEWIGDFSRAVESVEESGSVSETISWQNIRRRFAEGGQPFGEPESFPWAEGVSYPFSAEDSYEEFHWGYETFPRDLSGWNAMLLTIDAHFEFDFLRSSRHGAIESLRRIGDQVVAPDSGSPFAIRFDPFIAVPAFNKQNLRTSFAGISLLDDEPVAIISFDMDPSPFSMKLMENELTQSSTFNGTLTVRLSDGRLERGAFAEWVFNSGGTINAIYEIVRIDEQQYNAGA